MGLWGEAATRGKHAGREDDVGRGDKQMEKGRSEMGWGGDEMHIFMI